MKFYKLSEFDLPLIFSLSESEIKVWCWLSVHLPFDNSRELEIDTSQLAEEIGISRRSVQRALKAIQENEVFEVEFTKAKVKRKASQMSPSVTDVAEASQMSPTQPETPTVQAFENPKIIKTYSDFKKTLSEGERENFIEFAKKKAAQLPNPPQLPQRWIEKNFDELRLLWYKSTGQVSPAQSSIWVADPRSQEWLDKIRSLGFAAFIYESKDLDKERKEFYEWANSNNLIWGDET